MGIGRVDQAVRPEKKVLCHFSSNLRPRYAQDILNILAAPGGVTYTSRYVRRVVPDALASAWGDQLIGKTVLIHFSLEQPARYHEPVFFPIRSATVTQAHQLGNDLFVLQFALGRMIGLTEPDEHGGDKRFADRAHAYTNFLKDMLGDDAVPYGTYVSGGDDVTRRDAARLDTTDDELQLFERNTRYISRTDAFAAAWFIHAVGIAEHDDESFEVVRSRMSGQGQPFSLVGGTTYRIYIVQRQPRDITTEASFVIDTDDEVLHVIGRKGFTIGSGYDRFLIPVFAKEPPGDETRSVIAIRPDGCAGPTVEIPVRVTPSIKSAGAAVGTGVSLFLLGVLTLTPGAEPWVKGLFFAAALGVYLVAPIRKLVRVSVARKPRRQGAATRE